MAYYDALISAWNSGAVPTGYSGSAFQAGDTQAQKLAKMNGWSKTGSVPVSFYTTGDKLLNCINYAEFKALTATQQANLLALCSVPGQLLGGSGNTAFMAAGMILDYFTNHSGLTIAALTALAQASTSVWWQDSGYGGPIGSADLTIAGLS